MLCCCGFFASSPSADQDGLLLYPGFLCDRERSDESRKAKNKKVRCERDFSMPPMSQFGQERTDRCARFENRRVGGSIPSLATICIGRSSGEDRGIAAMQALFHCLRVMPMRDSNLSEIVPTPYRTGTH
jgi:hypothetical protein